MNEIRESGLNRGDVAPGNDPSVILQLDHSGVLATIGPFALRFDMLELHPDGTSELDLAYQCVCSFWTMSV